MTTEERLAHLEGAYAHLATKADVEGLRADFRTELQAGLSAINQRIDQVNQRIDRAFWVVVGIGGALLATAIAALVQNMA